MTIMIRNMNLSSEEDFRRALTKARSDLSDFRKRSNPAVRTPELWDRFFQFQANAVWLEDSLRTMERRRTKSESKRQSKQTVRQRWLSKGGDDDE